MHNLKSLIILFALLMLNYYAGAQATCTYTVDNQQVCQDATVTFTAQISGGSTITGYKWDFGNGQVNNQNMSTVNFVYTAAGTYTPVLTVYFSNGDSCVTTSNLTINVFPKPIVKYYLKYGFQDTQCNEGNYFCLIDSSYPNPTKKSPIVRRLLLWDDGSIDSTGSSWGANEEICHSYGDPAARSYTPRLIITDSNGCVVLFELKDYLTVRGKIGPSFSTAYNLKCDSTDVTFYNNTNIQKSDIEYFEWTFGDGTKFKSNTPPSQGDFDKNWDKFIHWYKTQGPFAGRLYVRSKFGCKDSFDLSKAGDNVNLNLKPWVEEDTMCAAGNILAFHQKALFTPQPGTAQVYWIWNHPPPENIDSGTWDPKHSFPGCKFPSGGKIYIIARTWVPPCIKRDSVDKIKLYGPSAGIESPPMVMLADTERHQCDVKDTVHFTNVSDTCTGLYKVDWYWDFDDASNPHSLNDTAYFKYYNLGPKNDTTYGGMNKLKNTHYSREWKPVHMYDSSETNERCHTPKFIMDGWFLKWDTVNQFMDTIHCHSEGQVPLALMNPRATNLVTQGQQCLGPMPPYGITFKWDKSKPGCTQQYVSICFDSACCAFTPSGKYNDPACWTEQAAFSIPPWSPFPPWPTSYKRPYFFTCDDSTGWVTVGLVIHNRRGESDSNVAVGRYKRCSDTVWYHRKLRFVNNQPGFGALEIDDSPYFICPRGTVTFVNGVPYQDSIIAITWIWGDGGFTVDSIWRRPVYKRIRYEYDMYGTVKTSDLTTQYGDTDMVSPRYHTYPKRGIYKARLTLMNTDSCEQSGKVKRIIIGNCADVYYDPTYACISNGLVTFHHELHYYNRLGPPFEPDCDTAHYWVDPTTNPYTGLSRAKPYGGYETSVWIFDDFKNPSAPGNGSGHTVTHQYTKMGTYHPYLAWKDSTGCRDTFFMEIYIDSLNANFGMDKPVVACDQLVHFYDSSGVFGPCVAGNPNCTDKIVTWFWDFGDGKTPSVLQNPVHQYLYPGIYYVTLIVQSQIGCYDTIVRPIRVKGPAPKFTIVGDTTGCVPFTVTFDNQSDSISKEFTWTWGDGKTDFTKSDTNFTHTYTKEGIFDIYLTATGNVFDSTLNRWLTCTFTYPDSAHPIRVYVRATPPVLFDVPARVCIGEVFPVLLAPDSMYETHYVYYGDSTQDTGVLVKHRSNTPPGIDTLFHSYSKAGTYIVTYTARYNPTPWCFDTKYDTIVVTDVTADFDVDSSDEPLFKFTNRSSSNSIKWYWDFGHPSSGSKNTSTNKDASHDYGNDIGTYPVTLVAESPEGCKDTVVKYVNNDYMVEIKIPNSFTPDKDGNNDFYYVHVKGLSKEEDNYRLYIYNQWGEMVFVSKDTTVRWNGKNMNTGADCPTGTYYFNFYYKLRAWKDLKKDEDYEDEQITVEALDKEKGYGFAKGSITLLRKE